MELGLVEMASVAGEPALVALVDVALVEPLLAVASQGEGACAVGRGGLA